MYFMDVRRTHVIVAAPLIVVAAVALVSGCEDDATQAGDTGPGEAMIDVSDADTQTDVIDDTTPRDVGDELDTTPTDTSSDIDDTMPADGTSESDVVTDAPSPDGGDRSWRQCMESSDCILTKNNCCGWCGTATMDKLDAVHRDRTDAHFKDVCPNPNSTPCPACLEGPIPESFEAHCAANTCEKIDLDPYQQCTRDSECRIRTLDCCENCQADVSTEALVAINSSEADQVRQALCPTTSPGCAECPIQYPSGVAATCNSDGRCVLN